MIVWELRENVADISGGSESPGSKSTISAQTLSSSNKTASPSNLSEVLSNRISSTPTSPLSQFSSPKSPRSQQNIRKRRHNNCPSFYSPQLGQNLSKTSPILARPVPRSDKTVDLPPNPKTKFDVQGANMLNLSSRRESKDSESKKSSILSRSSSKSRLDEIHRLKCDGDKYFDQFKLDSTIHGLSDWLDSSNNFTKFFWALALFVGTIATVYGLIAIFVEYYTTAYVVTYVVADDRDRKLPDIVICPFNRFNQSKLNEFQIDDDMTEYIQLSFGINPPYEFGRNYTDIIRQSVYDNSSIVRKQDQLDLELLRLNMSLEELVFAISYTCENLLLHCSNAFQSIDCCKTAIPVPTPIGICFRIKGVHQAASGKIFGYTMVIRPPRGDELSRGLTLLHNQGMSIKLALDGRGMDFDLTFIPIGMHVLVPLRATQFMFKNDPPNYECQDTVPPGYSPFSCYDDCMLMALANKECNCRHITFRTPKYLPVCNPLTLFTCLPSLYTPVEIEKCTTLCKPVCNYWEFKPTTSYQKYSTRTLQKYLSNTTLDAHWEEHILLDVFYERLDYTIVKHVQKMNVDILISNLGGQLGLWMGGSMITLVQLISFACWYCRSKMQIHRLQFMSSRQQMTSPKTAASSSNSPQTASHAPELETEENSSSCTKCLRCRKHPKKYIEGSINMDEIGSQYNTQYYDWPRGPDTAQADTDSSVKRAAFF